MAPSAMQIVEVTTAKHIL